MKLAPRDAAGFLAKPDPAVPAVLIYGADPMRVADRRQALLRAITGPDAEAEMRLTRMSGSELRRDPAQLIDAMKASGFFPGPRAVFLDDAVDGLAGIVAEALGAWAPGDAQLVATAGALTSASKLRKLFEGDKRALVLAVYDDPMGRSEIEAALRAEGLTPPPEAAEALSALAQVLEPGDFRQTLTRIALYKLGDPAPLTAAEVAALAPASHEAAIDDMLDAVAEGQSGLIAPLQGRLAAQGVSAVALCIGLLRHFRLLHALACDPAGAAQGVHGLGPRFLAPGVSVCCAIRANGRASGWSGR
jgi:DNA polymerase III subunit delta